MKKKNLPLTALKALEPFVEMKGTYFTIENPVNNLLVAKDKDPESDFFYIIEKHEIQDSKDVYTIHYAPKNEKDIKQTARNVFSENLTTTFNEWVLLLEKYSNVKSFYDDPILESYQTEFISNFEFLDGDADKNPFHTTQIIQLDYLLDQVSIRLIELSDENNRQVIDAIAAEISEIRENLSTRSKKWIVDQIGNVYAKIAKQGIKFIKEFWAEGKKEIIKNIVKGLIESGTDFLNIN